MKLIDCLFDNSRPTICLSSLVTEAYALKTFKRCLRCNYGLFCLYIAQKWRPRIIHTQARAATAKDRCRNIAKQRICCSSNSSSNRTHLRDIQFTHLTWQGCLPRITDTGEDMAHHRLSPSSRSRWSLLEPGRWLEPTRQRNAQRVSRAPSFVRALSAGAAACRSVWPLFSWPVSSLRWSNTYNYCQPI